MMHGEVELESLALGAICGTSGRLKSCRSTELPQPLNVDLKELPRLVLLVAFCIVRFQRFIILAGGM